MATKYHQITLSETFSDCQNTHWRYSIFLQILSEHFDLHEFIPFEFQSAFYLSIDRNRIYSLHGFLSAFILQNIFSIPTYSLLLLFLNLCKELRVFPGIQRDSKECNDTYKIRTIVERTINHFKINMCITGRKTRNHTTTKADVFLAGIASQMTVIVAYAMNSPQYIRSLNL